jgi:hypothetical protein
MDPSPHIVVTIARQLGAGGAELGRRLAHRLSLVYLDREIVDRAARDVLEERGFGRDFKHPTGHGVGFLAIDHNAAPRLHPKSAETLETGMVFNVEPAIYRHLWGGCRHCDMVTVTARGAELLSDFQTRPEDLVVDRSLTVADRERVFA